MKKLFLGLFIIALIAGAGCKSKQDCEYDHTGTLKVENISNLESEVRLDGNKLFVMAPGDEKEKTVSSGTHDLRCFTTGVDPKEISRPITFEDCETTVFKIKY